MGLVGLLSLSPMMVLLEVKENLIILLEYLGHFSSKA
jgi:hypothetical protein